MITKKFIIAIAAITTVVGISALASAEERVVTSNRTVTGAAIGAGTGAVIAGPPGAIVGGVIGAVVGGPKIAYYHHHRSYTDERQRHYYWDNHRRHYY
jgi:osmotically inducible lipoprotein OsmB